MSFKFFADYSFWSWPRLDVLRDIKTIWAYLGPFALRVTYGKPMVDR